MDIHSTVSGDKSAGEMGDLEKVLEKLTANRWLLGAALFVFLVLVSSGLLDVITAIGCIIILFATAIFSPNKSKQADASTVVAVDNAEIYDEAFAFLNVIPDP
ncbi:MAG: hypothetical protein AAF412_09915, partial [Pseudomonadota bacterium]